MARFCFCSSVQKILVSREGPLPHPGPGRLSVRDALDARGPGVLGRLPHHRWGDRVFQGLRLGSKLHLEHTLRSWC